MKKLTGIVLPFLLIVLLIADCTKAGGQTATNDATTPRYKDSRLPVEDRVADLLARMTVEEKIDQVASGWEKRLEVLDPTGSVTSEMARKVILNEWGDEQRLTPRQMATLRNAIQRYQIEKTRLGIPVIFYSESLHGLMEYGATSYPQALGLGATWDPALVKRVFTAIGDEAGSRGVGQVYSPNLDLGREPRFGRTEETYGEDPFLVSQMGVAAIEGLQGDSWRIDRHHVLATAKHFAVHGQPEGGTNTAPENYSERVIRENHLVPFKAAVEQARVGSIMASYNEIDGVPNHMNRWLLENVLRQEWGFRGYVTSDADGLALLMQAHHVAHDIPEAARLGLLAGVDYDLELGNAGVYRTLPEQIRTGLVPASALDRAVARLLMAKFRLGLFEEPYVDPNYTERITNSDEHRELAVQAARETLVLLKNENGLLPLDLTKLKTVAVIGPGAADVHVGGYSRDSGRGVSVLDGIKARVAEKAKVLYAEGCKITTAPQGQSGFWSMGTKLVDPKTQTAAIAAAVETAKKADVAILVVGENESTNREAWENHYGDRDSLDLLGAQNGLVRAVVETGKPVIVLLLGGRPLSVNYIAEKVPAVLAGFYLGQEGGRAAAEVIFGDVNPGGKLPITFPSSVGALPDYYNHKPTRTSVDYEFSTGKPLWPFGFGLSYTTFAFENLRVQPTVILPAGTAKVSVDVTNTGTRAGDEVAELYVHPRVSSVTQPVIRLTGFKRIALRPGEKQTVEFTVTPEMLSILNLEMKSVVEPGAYELKVGPSSDKTTTTILNVEAGGTPGLVH